MSRRTAIVLSILAASAVVVAQVAPGSGPFKAVPPDVRIPLDGFPSPDGARVLRHVRRLRPQFRTPLAGHLPARMDWHHRRGRQEVGSERRI